MNIESHTLLEVAAKSIPPAALTVWSFWGFTLNEWAALTAIVYSLLMTFFLLKDRYNRWKLENELKP